MGIWQAPQVTNDMGIDELRNLVAMLIKDMDYLLNGFIDSKNVREIAGYNVSQTELKHKSGIVGMSGADPADPTAERFWAGSADPSAAPFRVQQNGTMYATDGHFTGDIDGSTITGGTIRTAAANNQRIEISAGSLKGYTADNLLSGLVFDPIKASDIVDLFLYHRGAQLVEFFDDINTYRIRGGPDSVGITFGISTKPTTAAGNWTFTGTVSGISISSISGLEARLQFLENNAFINATRSGTLAVFDSKNIASVDSVDVT